MIIEITVYDPEDKSNHTGLGVDLADYESNDDKVYVIEQLFASVLERLYEENVLCNYKVEISPIIAH